MILSSLVNLAKQEGLLAAAHLNSQSVHWLITIDQDGEVLSVTENIHTVKMGKKEKQVHGNLTIPKRKGRAGKVSRPDWLVDKSDYMLGFNLKHAATETPSKAVVKDAQWLADCFADCLAETQTIAAATQSSAVAAQVKAMQWIHHNFEAFSQIWCGASEKRQQAFHAHQGWLEVPKSWKNNHLFSFMVNKQHVCSYPEVDDYLQQQLQAELAGRDDDVMGRCLVTGEFGPLAKLHDQVNLPGDTGPLPIISFNLKAFEHYGLSNNENAQIGKPASVAFNLALRRLIGEGDFENWPKRNYKISNKTTALFWSEHAGTSDDPFDDMLPDHLFYGGESEASIESVLKSYHSPKKGKPNLLEDTSKIYTITLTREKSRAALRQATMTTTKDVAASLLKFFTELEIANVHGDIDKPYRSVTHLTWAVEKPESTQGKEQENLNARLFECALDQKKRYPTAMLAKVLERIRAQDKEGPSRRRMALIKAILIRNYGKEYLHMDHSEQDTTAYALGRLFATLERIQYVATKAKAGIVQRYIGAACTTPALVFPRLLKLSNHHLHKVGEGFEFNYKKRIDGILGTVVDKAFPRTLSLEAQGEFMIGYHHQRHQFAQEDTERQAKAKEQNPSAVEEANP